MYCHLLWQSIDQPGKLTNPARGQLNNENMFPPSPLASEISISRDSTAVPSRASLLNLHTQAESGAYSRDSSYFPPPERLLMYTVNRHRVCVEFIRQRNCVSMAFTVESPPARWH